MSSFSPSKSPLLKDMPYPSSHHGHNHAIPVVNPTPGQSDSGDNVNALSIRSPPSSEPQSPPQPEHREQKREQEQKEKQHQQAQYQERYPSLPSELILHIFKFLASPQDLRSAILVCKLWCSCGMDLLWSRPALLSLSLVQKMCKTMSLDRSETIFPYTDYVRRLNFSLLSQDLTDATLIRFRCCTRLERLLLPGCAQTTEEGLKQVVEIGQGLHSLDLSDVPAVTDSVLEHVARHCPKLHTLYLAGCTQLTDKSVVQLATNCRSLKRVKLSQCVLLTDRSVIALAQHCPHLMEMDVTNCSLMTNNAIQSVFKALPQIRDLNMTLLANLTDQAFTSIPLGTSTSLSSPTMSPSSPNVVRFDQLRVLNLTSCVHITDETLARIIPAAPRLRNLTLTKCDRITDAGASVIKILGKHLHYLHLGHCSRLTDKAITTLAQHCTRIRYLDLACCSKLTDGAVFAMAQLPKLRRIGLVKCSNITDHGIYAMLVSQVVPLTLERVHLSYCVHLSDTAVAALVQQCSKLTHLSVTGVPAFMSPRYQTFCRTPPSEFTQHQREVFCVFSGKGVRELRQYMQENPTVTASTMTSIQRSYRIMGSTVASMVAGGQHSSAILAHLGLTLRESEAHVQQLAAHQDTDAHLMTVSVPGSLPVSEDESGSGSGSGSATVLDTLSVVAVPGSPRPLRRANMDETEDGSSQREALTLELEQRREEIEQAGHDYATMMAQQHLLSLHHSQLTQRREYLHRRLHEQVLNGSSSSSHDIHNLDAGGQEGFSSSSSSSSSSSTPLDTQMHAAHPHLCAQQSRLRIHGISQQEQDQEQMGGGGQSMDDPVGIHIEDVRMTTPVSMKQQHHEHRQVGEGEGSSGGSEDGSPAEDEEEDVDVDADEDVFEDEDDDPIRR